MRRRLASLRSVAPLLAGGLLAGCALTTPLPKASSLDERLAAMPTRGLPLDQPVTIRWNAHHIPFIEAATDDDAAFALGLVHAHLRLGQMAVYRQIAYGRVSAMGGPLAIEFDEGLKRLDFPRAAAASVAAMPAQTRRWLQRFADGVNHYQSAQKQLPVEYRILGLERTPWTVEDFIAFGRLAGSDVSWLVFFNLLKLRPRNDWPQIWSRLLQDGGARAGLTPRAEAPELTDVLHDLSRSGSNSLAIAPRRSRSGSALLANDPHLGLNLPNTWLLVGLKSPGYHAVGMMIPGLPLFAIGRNPQIAWGGTNMRATASDLVDVSTLSAAERTVRTAPIEVRWWFDTQTQVHETRFGPVVSDTPQLRSLALPDLALRWTGHQPSDEVTAMLKVARAQNFAEFSTALATFSLPAQNMLYADADGHIGKVFAAHVPDRGGAPPGDLLLSPGQSDRAWERVRTAADLPVIVDPEEGFIASANNRPPRDLEAPVGWFFSPEDRIERMAELVERAGQVDVEHLKAMHRDVHVGSSARLNALLVDKLRASGVAAAAQGEARRAFELMAAWNGDYRADDPAPVAFEVFRSHFTSRFYQSLFGETDWAAFAGVGSIKALLIEDIGRSDPDELADALRGSLEHAGARLAAFPTWGDMHRLVLRHPLAFLPVIGERYEFADHPVGGSTDSLMKTAHGATDQRHRASYGANARHISDLGDPDRNWFVLLGGQDGWLNSSTFLDQLPLWLEGRYVQMPLRPETVRAQFPRVMELQR